MHRSEFDTGERMVFTLMRCALLCIALSLGLGALAALYYIPAVARAMQSLGLSLAQLRPLHTTYASAWIFLGAVTVVHKYLVDRFGAPSPADRLRFRVQMICWGTAGLGILLTLPLGITSGREYLGFHPIFSLFIALGWIAFAITFFSKVRHGFWARPVYVYMWSAGILFFLYTFAEGHAWLLPGVASQPVADLQIQWKSCGSLVASFNQMVYGCLMFLGERVSGETALAQSRAAFALFGIGLLNSFTNSAHHTYHLPQSHLLKWVAFAVSMLEIIILFGVLRDVARQMARPARSTLDFAASVRFVELSRTWTLFLLILAVLISVPPLNALIHGTHVVMAHAMGSELAIDSYILLGCFAFLLAQLFPKRETLAGHLNSGAVRRAINGLNACLVGLILWIFLDGLGTGIARAVGRPQPEWLSGFPYLFVVLGLACAGFLVRLLLLWLPLLLRPARHRSWYGWAPSRDGPPAD